MPDYSSELKQAQKLYYDKFYDSAIRHCSAMIEEGLKELYNSLELYFSEKEEAEIWHAMHEKFNEVRGNPFQIEMAGLGSMLLFARNTEFWIHLKDMCDSNLHFLRMINWGRVRSLRNSAAHNSANFGDMEAMEMLFYTKVFLYDCGLIEGPPNPVPEILDAHCLECTTKIKKDWNYCPHCAAQVHQTCHNCNKKLQPTFRICSHCDSPRMCTTDQNNSTESYRKYAEAVWADWEITPMERQWLEIKRLELGIDLAEAESIEKSVIPPNYYHFLNLIDAVNIDGIIDSSEEKFLLIKAENLQVPEKAALKMIHNSRADSKRIRKSLLNIRFL